MPIPCENIKTIVRLEEAVKVLKANDKVRAADIKANFKYAKSIKSVNLERWTYAVLALVALLVGLIGYLLTHDINILKV